jgi:hypothetical protein
MESISVEVKVNQKVDVDVHLEDVMEAVFSYLDSVAVWKIFALGLALIAACWLYDKCTED